MLKIEHITTGYGKKQALNDVSFEVTKGEIILLTGANGSGKSTVLKTIYGLLKPWNNGKIYFEGKDITALPTTHMIHLGIVYVPQKMNVFEDFSVEENLLTSANIYSKAEAIKRKNRVLKLLPILNELQNRTPFHLSGGERQLLALGNALVHDPKLVLFDEPFAGVDPENTTNLNNTIQIMRDNAVTFIIAEHKKNILQSVDKREVLLELGMIKK